jgi:hypothetical protein
MEGVNLLPFLKGENSNAPHDRLYWRHRNAAWAIREGEWKLLQEPGGARHQYHITEDISEQNDLLASEPEIASRLWAAWNSWNAANGSRIPWDSPENEIKNYSTPQK